MVNKVSTYSIRFQYSHDINIMTMKPPTKNIYQDGTYAKNNPTFGDGNADWKASSALKAIEKYKLDISDLAEVGCGGGQIILNVAEALKVNKALGYEPMPEAFAVADSRSNDQVKFINVSIDENTKADHDLMLCFDVFEHIEDCFRFLRDLKETSKHFLFHIPLDMNAQLVLRTSQLMRVRDQVGHIHYYSRDSALATLKDCGYEIKGEFYTSAADSIHCKGFKSKVLNIFRKIGYKISKHFTVRLMGGYSLMVYAVPKKD